MNDLPREPQPPEDVDDFYRRASALDPSRPGEHVRRAVLSHAEELAAVRARSRARPRRPLWQPAVFGTLAAAVLAGLVIAPHWLSLQPPAGTAAPPTPTAAERSPLAREALPATPPASAAAAPADHRVPSAPVPSAPSPSAPASAAHAGGAPEPATPPARAHEETGGATLKRYMAEAAPLGGLNAPSEAQLSARDTNAVRNQPVSPDAVTSDAAASNETRTTAARAAAPPAAPRVQLAETEMLQQAADTGDLATLRRLLSADSNIDGRDSQGRTALMHAVRHNQAQAVELLLAAGANPNAADGDGTSPLQAAEASGERAIVEALQRYGAR